MLAQNFMTPADLKIGALEFETLVKVLGMLDRGEIAASLFTMRRVGTFSEHRHYPAVDPTDCGSAGCLIGWARHVSQRNLFPAFAVYSGTALYRLFMFTYGVDDPIDEIRKSVTPSQAAIALRNYLSTGEPRWDEALQAN